MHRTKQKKKILEQTYLMNDLPFCDVIFWYLYPGISIVRFTKGTLSQNGIGLYYCKSTFCSSLLISYTSVP